MQGKPVERDLERVGGQAAGEIEGVDVEIQLAFIHVRKPQLAVEPDLFRGNLGEERVGRGGEDDMRAAGQGDAADGDVRQGSGRGVGFFGGQEFQDAPVGGRGVVAVGEDAGAVEGRLMDIDFAAQGGHIVHGNGQAAEGGQGVHLRMAAFVAERVRDAGAVVSGEFVVRIDQQGVFDLQVEVGETAEGGSADPADLQVSVHIIRGETVHRLCQERIGQHQLQHKHHQEPEPQQDAQGDFQPPEPSFPFFFSHAGIPSNLQR